MVEFKVKGINLEGAYYEDMKLSTKETVEEMNKKGVEYVFYDSFDDTHNCNEELTKEYVEDLKSTYGIDKAYVMGNFNNGHKEMLLLGNDFIEEFVA